MPPQLRNFGVDLEQSIWQIWVRSTNKQANAKLVREFRTNEAFENVCFFSRLGRKWGINRVWFLYSSFDVGMFLSREATVSSLSKENQQNPS